MNKTRINNMIKPLELYSNKRVILKEDENNEFDLNSFLKPNPNQKQKYEQELERLKKEFKKTLSKIKLGLQRIDKAYENKQWESEKEELFLELFYKSEVEFNLEELPNLIFIIKDGKYIAHQDLKYKYFWIDYQTIWKKKNIHFLEIMVKKYFKLSDYTII